MTIPECLDRIDWTLMRVQNGQIVSDQGWHPLAVAFGGPLNCDMWAKWQGMDHEDVLLVLCAGITSNEHPAVVEVREQMLKRMAAARPNDRDWRLDPTSAEQVQANGWVERYQQRREDEMEETA